MSAGERPPEHDVDASGTTQRIWRYDSGSATPDPYPADFAAFESMLDTAWRELLFEHMAFGVVSTDERERLLGSLRTIERIFADTTDAREIEYYQESFFGAEPKAETLSRTQLRHVVLMQAQLMEQAYFALTLARSANAPSNRGWMNLFRRWAGSRTFNEWFDRYRELFSRQFVAFYDNYLRFYNRTIDVAPLPHPWDPQMPLAPHAPPPADEEQRQREMLWRQAGMPIPARRWRIPGVFLDSGIVEMPIDALTGESSDKSGGSADAAPMPSGQSKGPTTDSGAPGGADDTPNA
jgi:hypothetical protein